MSSRRDRPWTTDFPAYRKVRALTSRVLETEDVDVLIEQVNRFDDEIRTALRSTTTAVTVGLVVLTLGASLVKDVSRDLGLLIIFPLLGLAVSVHSQVAADVAVMAEVRDRLAMIVNIRRDYPLLNVRLISDVRRFARGTAATIGTLFAVVVGAAYLIAAYAWTRTDLVLGILSGHAFFWVAIVMMTLSFTAVVFAIRDQSLGRAQIMLHLDDVFGCGTRPDHLIDEDHDACSRKQTFKLKTCPFFA